MTYQPRDFRADDTLLRDHVAAPRDTFATRLRVRAAGYATWYFEALARMAENHGRIPFS